jgi:hypothetical protein
MCIIGVIDMFLFCVAPVFAESGAAASLNKTLLDVNTPFVLAVEVLYKEFPYLISL